MILEDLRKEIDEINLELIRLFERRLDVAKKIAKVKKQENLPIHDAVREKYLLEEIRIMAEEKGLSPAIMQEIFKLFIDYTRIIMKMEGEKDD